MLFYVIPFLLDEGQSSFFQKYCACNNPLLILEEFSQDQGHSATAVKLPGNLIDDDASPEITFEAQLTTTTTYAKEYIRNKLHASPTLFEDRETPAITNRNTVMTIEFKCRSYERDALLCYIGKHKFDPPEMRILVHISDRHRQTLFQIRFDNRGVVDYTIEKATNSTMEFLLNLYRFFGSQLSSGFSKSSRNSNFYAREQSVIGSCSTNFIVTHKNYTENEPRMQDITVAPSPDENMSLSFVNNFSRKDEIINISKQRDTKQCRIVSNYMFATSYWDEFLPSDVEEVMILSQSTMTLYKNNFQSTMTNVFHLYDMNTKIAGNVIENINVTLKSITFPEDTESRIFLRPVFAKVIASKG